MKIRGNEYRFVVVCDPPFEYGIGLDDPDNEYWVIPARSDRPTRVYSRPLLPVEDGMPVHDWQEVEDKGLEALGDMLTEHSITECRFGQSKINARMCFHCACQRGGDEGCPPSQPMVMLMVSHSQNEE